VKEQLKTQKKAPEDTNEDEAVAILQSQLRSEAEWLRLFPGKQDIHI